MRSSSTRMAAGRTPSGVTTCREMKAWRVMIRAHPQIHFDRRGYQRKCEVSIIMIANRIQQNRESLNGGLYTGCPEAAGATVARACDLGSARVKVWADVRDEKPVYDARYPTRNRFRSKWPWWAIWGGRYQKRNDCGRGRKLCDSCERSHGPRGSGGDPASLRQIRQF